MTTKGQLENPPTLKKCHKDLWEALSSGANPSAPYDVPYSRYSEMSSVLSMSYPKGKGTSEGESAFDERLFNAFRHYLGEAVAGEITTQKEDGTKSLAIIVLKGEWFYAARVTL